MSTGGAIALAVLTGFGASTNKVTVTLGIKNCDDKSLLWKYDHNTGGIGSSPERWLIIMRQASKKMPYFKVIQLNLIS